ncbi:MAG: NUDIX hydrolase [Planctomycetota bacterium]
MTALSPEKWQQISKEPLLQNPYYRISKDQYSLPGGGVGEYMYVDIPGSSMVVPVRDDGSLVMVRQYRYLMQRTSLEFPCGGVVEGVDPLENAQRELKEEAGHAARDWHELGRFAPYNGVSNEYCYVFLATNLTAIGAEPEETEEIEIVYLRPDEVRAQIDTGDLWDGMTIASLSVYESWLRQRNEHENESQPQ